MAGKPIPVTMAMTMVGQYADYISNLQTQSDKKTEYTIFSLPDLMDWLKSVEPYADEIKVCMGLYPADAPQAGRLTVILWPYSAGKPSAEPFQGKDGGGGGGMNPYNDGNNGP